MVMVMVMVMVTALAMLSLLCRGDTLSCGVAWVLLLMSVASWVIILFKSWLLYRSQGDVTRSIAAFWQSASLADATPVVQSFDRSSLVLPLVLAMETPSDGTLACAGELSVQTTRRLRTALHTAAARLQSGQIWLATVGATAPFVGLLGTVWGIYHALISLTGASSVSITQISGPVGQSLIMTAAGLAVALPAVVAYNVQGRVALRLEAQLDGFAHDLRGLLCRNDGSIRFAL